MPDPTPIPDSTPTPASQDEIVAFYQETRPLDLFGWYAEVLVTAMDFDHARPLLKADVTEEVWTADGCPKTPDALRADAVDYLTFAFGKAAGHRGLSADRSVHKMAAYLFLLGYPLEEYDTAGHENYGVPKLLVAARLLGTWQPGQPATGKDGEPDATEVDDLVRMGQGLPCELGCQLGCGT
jgi:hypothetical protein